MRSALADALGIEFPIFAFSHCRDVVAEVSRCGGLGVLGAVSLTPDRLDQELAWVERHCGGRPFGIDVVVPRTADLGEGQHDPDDHLTAAATFAISTLGRLGIAVSDGLKPATTDPAAISVTEQLDVLVAHGGSVLVNARGVISSELMDRARAHGIRVGALAGRVEHARRHAASGVDFVVAQGAEAAGHAGVVSTMVLVPEVVDAIAPTPVLAAGGIADGRQIAAARALGADGVWLGSVWLATWESELDPPQRERFLAAASTDAVLSDWYDGTPGRQLITPWTEAWGSPEAPARLSRTAQRRLADAALDRIRRAGRGDIDMVPAGQVVGLIRKARPVQEVFFDLVEGYLQTVALLQADDL